MRVVVSEISLVGCRIALGESGCCICRLLRIENLKIGLKKRWFMTTLVLLLKN